MWHSSEFYPWALLQRWHLTVFVVSAVLNFLRACQDSYTSLFWCLKNRWKVLLCCSPQPVCTWAYFGLVFSLVKLHGQGEALTWQAGTCLLLFFFFLKKSWLLFLFTVRAQKQSEYDKFQRGWRRWSTFCYCGILRGEKHTEMFLPNLFPGCVDLFVWQCFGTNYPSCTTGWDRVIMAANYR